MATTGKTAFMVPARADVSANNQAIFDHMQNAFGMVRNLDKYQCFENTL